MRTNLSTSQGHDVCRDEAESREVLPKQLWMQIKGVGCDSQTWSVQAMVDCVPLNICAKDGGRQEARRSLAQDEAVEQLASTTGAAWRLVTLANK